MGKNKSGGSHKRNEAQRRKRELFRLLHPEGRKEFARRKREQRRQKMV